MILDPPEIETNNRILRYLFIIFAVIIFLRYTNFLNLLILIIKVNPNKINSGYIIKGVRYSSNRFEPKQKYISIVDPINNRSAFYFTDCKCAGIGVIYNNNFSFIMIRDMCFILLNWSYHDEMFLIGSNKESTYFASVYDCCNNKINVSTSKLYNIVDEITINYHDKTYTEHYRNILFTTDVTSDKGPYFELPTSCKNPRLDYCQSIY